MRVCFLQRSRDLCGARESSSTWPEGTRGETPVESHNAEHLSARAGVPSPKGAGRLRSASAALRSGGSGRSPPLRPAWWTRLGTRLPHLSQPQLGLGESRGRGGAVARGPHRGRRAAAPWGTASRVAGCLARGGGGSGASNQAAGWGPSACPQAATGPGDDSGAAPCPPRLRPMRA